MTIINVENENLNKIIEDANTKPVVVDFWAPWCAPCRMMAPIFEELTTKYEWKVIFVKCDVDNNPQTAISYWIQGIPTIAFIKDWEVINKTVGVQSVSTFEDIINKLI